MFHADITYHNRETKAGYVFEKYRPILEGSVLDVGADAMYLKPYLASSEGRYVGVGHGDKVDHEVNLETSALPFGDHSFDTVLCLDVLEHLEAAHFMFAELCRVSKHHVIISLPNPWGSFFNSLVLGDYSSTAHMKFYGLPPEPPKDRHRWFFSEDEAKAFLRHNAEKAGFTIVQMDGKNEGAPMGGNGIRGIVGRWVLRRIFRRDITELGLHHGTLWCVLQRASDR